MTLREFLKSYSSVSKIYIEHYINEYTSENTELFRDLSLIPEVYLDANITSWRHKLDCGIIGTNIFSITPIVIIDKESI